MIMPYRRELSPQVQRIPGFLVGTIDNISPLSVRPVLVVNKSGEDALMDYINHQTCQGKGLLDWSNWSTLEIWCRDGR
jgi:hypothetical protein